MSSAPRRVSLHRTTNSESNVPAADVRYERFVRAKGGPEPGSDPRASTQAEPTPPSSTKLRCPVLRLNAAAFSGRSLTKRGSAARLINVPGDNRLAKQVTGTQSYGPHRGVDVRISRSAPQIVLSRVVKTAGIVKVRLYSHHDVLPGHVFQTDTDSPTIAPIREFRKHAACQVYGTPTYSYASPANLRVQHRSVPRISELRGDRADLIDAN